MLPINRFLVKGRLRRRIATIPSAHPNNMASIGISCGQLGDWNQNRICVITVDDFAMSACSTNAARSSARINNSKGLPTISSASTCKINSHDGDAYITPRFRENRLRIMQARSSGASSPGFHASDENASWCRRIRSNSSFLEPARRVIAAE